MRFKAFFTEEKSKTIVFAYGRFNPPTVAHEMLVNKVISAAEQSSADYLVVPSHSTNPPQKNPLNIEQKIKLLQYMVTNPSAVSSIGITFIETLKKIQEMGYTNVIQVCGSDRMPEFQQLINKYNGKADKTGNVLFNFKKYHFVSAGERDPDSEGMEGMSASKLRNFALNGKLDEFKNGMSKNIPDSLKEQTFIQIRNAFGNSFKKTHQTIK